VKLPAFFRGMPQVALQEFTTNLKSVRLIVMALLSALLVVGGAYGFTALTSSFGGLPPAVAWAHPSYAPNGSHVAVVWVSDPYGAPFSDRPVEFEDENRTPLGTARSDADGFARFDVGTRDYVGVTIRIGTATFGTGVDFFPRPVNFTVYSLQGDYSRHGRPDGLGMSVLDRSGAPATANVSVNGTSVGTTDRFGYIRFDLPVGLSQVTVEVGGESETLPVLVPDTADGTPFSSGPDLVLAVIASLSFLIVSIFAIVLSFDAISKERVQGTMDLLLSRPSSRSGVLLGKFLGAFGAVAIPVTLVNLAGIGVIAAASGKGPTGAFAGAFLGGSLLLIALYVLLQLTLSTLAKTGGSAVLYGVLIWLLFNILYPIVTAVAATVLFSGDPAAYFRFTQASGLGNPTSIASSLVFLSAPPGFQGFGGSSLEPPVVGAAAAVWFVGLLALALWTFQKKAAE